MTEMYIRPLVCPTHGNLHRDEPGCRYVCHGFDGEGCPVVLTDEELINTPPGGPGWELIGTSDDPVDLQRCAQMIRTNIDVATGGRLHGQVIGGNAEILLGGDGGA